MSNTPTPEEQKLREQILKQGKVSKAKVVYSQRMYDNGTMSPMVTSSQDIVEIGIEELMFLIHQSNNDLIREIEGKVEALRQDERPVDSHTGEPVETYGYEVTNNEVVNQVKQILTNAIKGDK